MIQWIKLSIRKCHFLISISTINIFNKLFFYFKINSSFGGNDTCEINCIKKIRDTFDYNENCKFECPLECDSVSFDPVKDKEKIIDSDYYDNIKEAMNKSEKFSKFTFDSIREKLIILNINFDKMSFTQLTEIPK